MSKKLLLFLILFCSGIALQAQNFVQPTQFNNVCSEGSNTANFLMMEITYEILNGNNISDFTVTHHHSQADATFGVNSLPTMNYTNTSNPQLIFVRIYNNATGQATIMNYSLVVHMPPVMNTTVFTSCDTDSDGMTYIDLGTVSEMIWNNNQQNPNTLQLSFHHSYEGAQYDFDEIAQPFSNTVPFQQTIYVRGVYPQNGCAGVGTVNLIVAQCQSTCSAPVALTASAITMTSATISWSNTSTVFYNEVYYTMAGMPAPLPNTLPTGIAQGGSYTIGGVTCGTAYAVYVRAICASEEASTWTGPWHFTTLDCMNGGQPSNMIMCSDNGSACFNLSVNTPQVLGGLNPSEYTVTYHNTSEDAANDANAITNVSSYCTNIDFQQIFVRLENNTTNQFQVLAFIIMVNSVSGDIVHLQSMSQCDDNEDGSVIFDVTTAAAQINSTDPLVYYATIGDANAQINPIANPTAFAVPANVSTSVAIRRNIVGDCDVLYLMPLFPTVNCNISATCINAHSLCHSLGTPFINSQNLDVNETGANFGCLNTHPNPTWFYLPVNTAGTISLKIEQNSAIDFSANPFDVDYIVYGPYTNPAEACGQLTAQKIVSCSYSANAVEFPVIQNAQPGEYYIIMTTNFSNQAGYIRITETTNSTGGIACSGLHLNAFLDANNNGVKDNGEQNFPHGEFHFEKNDNGTVHHVSSPSGTYNLYDDNATNSYDLSFTLDAAYTSYYTITTASYSDVSVNIGTGMTTYNFPITIAQPYQDLAVNVVSIGSPRAGFAYTNKIIYTNYGNQTLATGVLTFTKDSALTITNISQPGTATTATGFTYTFTNLQPFETREIAVIMQVPPIPTVFLGQIVTNSASVLPLVGDIVPANNSHSISEIIIGSYDPNDKMESHGEEILVTEFTSNDYLYYTIRFENTGTASAINVRISDILDQKLDETTVKMVDASHDYILDRVNNTLTWRLDDIELPPSVADTPIGKGYVAFKVKPKAGYAAGDIIPNGASIYFDFNPAIVTNTFETKFVNVLKTPTFDKDQFSVYPNPASDVVNVKLENNSGLITAITITDISGKTVFSHKNAEGSATQSINVKAFSSGIYFIEVTANNNAKAVKKLIVK